MENVFAAKGEREISMCGSRYLQYNILGNLFQVSSKYVPPIQPVGRGAYGIICSATNSETKEPVVVKKITNAFDNIIDAKRTLRQIKLLGHMDHDNNVKGKELRITQPLIAKSSYQEEETDMIYIR